MDDIDSLLDQVENKYIKKEQQGGKRAIIKAAPPKDCACNKKGETDWDEVDELLRDFTFEDTNPFGKQNNNSWTRTEVKTSSDTEKREVKCFPVYLAGSYDVMGHSETGFERYFSN